MDEAKPAPAFWQQELYHIKFGAIDATLNLGFLLSLILACVITYYFARDKFGEPTSSPSSEDILSRLSPKLLTTTAEYDSAYRLYITFMLGLVLMLSVAAPKILGLDLEGDSLAPAFLPLIAAFVVIGFLPSAPGFQDIEKRVRRFTHERGHIPRAARKVQEKLNAASFKLEALGADARKYIYAHGVVSSDLIADPEAIEHSWAKLGVLIYKLRQDRRKTGAIGADPEVLDAISTEIDRISAARNDLEDDISDYRRLREPRDDQGDAHSNEKLHEEIIKLLKQCYILIGCAICLRFTDDSEIKPVLQKYGFDGEDFGYPQERDVLIVAMWIPMIAALLVSLAAGLWMMANEPSALFPRPPVSVYDTLIVSFLSYSLPLVATHAYLMKKHSKLELTHYLVIGVISALVGFAGNAVWASLSHSTVGFGVDSALPYIFLCAPVGIFFALYQRLNTSQSVLATLVVVQLSLAMLSGYYTQLAILTIDINNTQRDLVSMAEKLTAKTPELAKPDTDKETQAYKDTVREVTDLRAEIVRKTTYLDYFYPITKLEKNNFDQSKFDEAYKDKQFQVPAHILEEIEVKYRDLLILSAIMAGAIAASLGSYLAYQGWLDRKKPETVPLSSPKLRI